CRGAEEPPPPKPPEVRVDTVAEGTVQPEIPIAGVLAPLPGRDVKVGALVAGRVDRLFVGEGDRVRAGEPLAHVEARPMREHLAEVEAQQQQARAALENARIRLSRSEALFKHGIAAKQ